MEEDYSREEQELSNDYGNREYSQKVYSEQSESSEYVDAPSLSELSFDKNPELSAIDRELEELLKRQHA